MTNEIAQPSEISVLLIEDDAVTRAEISAALTEGRSAHFALTCQPSFEPARALIEETRFDAVVVAIQPPREQALDTVGELVALSPSSIVIAFGTIPESKVALDLIRYGAEDYLFKHDAAYRALPRVLQYAVERRRLDERCRTLTGKRTELQSLLSAVLSSVGTPVAIADEQDRLVMVNPAVTALYGWPMREAVGQQLSTFVTEAHSGQPTTFTCKDGRKTPIRMSSVSVEIEHRQWRVMTLDAASPSEVPSFAQDVSALFRDQSGRLIAGRVRMVSIEEVREKVGLRWEQVAERIYANAEAVIRSRLSPDDVFTRNALGQFILCFASLSEKDAWFKAQTIQKELRDKLLGEGLDAELAAVTVETHEVAAASEEVECADDIADMIADKLAQAAEQMRKNAERLLSEVLRTGQIQPRPVLTARGTASEFEIAEFDPDAQAKIEQIAAAGEDPKVAAQIDSVIIGRAADHLLGRPSRRKEYCLIVPLHFSTLYHRVHREKLMAILRQLPAPTRDSLALGVQGFPEDIWSARVTEFLNGLRPFCRSRSVHLERAHLGNINLQDAHVGLVSIDYSRLAGLNEKSGRALHNLLEQVHDARAHLLVTGVSSQAEAVRAWQTGADLIAYKDGSTDPGRASLQRAVSCS